LRIFNVIIVDDHSVVRDGIKLLLENDPAIRVIAVASNGTEALEAINRHNETDVLITDIQMPEADGFSLIAQTKSVNPKIKVIVLSMHNDMAHVTAAFESGASGYLLKGCTPDELVFAAKNTFRGGRYISMDLCDDLFNTCIRTEFDKKKKANPGIEFSERELEILGLISEGLTNNEISERLFLSKRTVEGHRQNLLDKTNCRNTAMLIKYAVQHGLIV
jgi:DNA-binding NarL/FixJ family response regulator